MAISHLFGISECLSIAKSRIPDRCGFCIGHTLAVDLAQRAVCSKKSEKSALKFAHTVFMLYIYSTKPSNT
jgi:hypothetical protein